MSIRREKQNKLYHITQLHTRSCAMLLKEKIEQLGLQVDAIKAGCISIKDLSMAQEHKLHELFHTYGFEVITNREQLLVEQTKQAVIELIHQMNNTNSVVRKSEYLVEKLGKSYAYLARLFSAYEPLTLEKYIILQKIERIKDLLDQDEYSLSEIAFMMDYNSVQYLSNQFHKITGLTVTEYKKSPSKHKLFWDDLSGQ